MKHCLARAAMIMLSCGTMSAQSWNWTFRSTVAANNHPARVAFAMVYDQARAKTVLFGGLAGGAVADTWEFDGTVWSEVTPTVSPSPRRAHAMVYDVARNKVVLFGGAPIGPSLNDTWEFDGSSWARISTVSSPPARTLPAYAYDSARSKFVLFGGYAGWNGRTDDTWEYDGVDWQQITTTNAPSPRESSGMAFDSVRNKIVLFGGWTGTSHTGDTWEYDGVTWSQVTTTTSPPPRSQHAITFDSTAGRTVISSGSDPALDDTWEFDGVNWYQATPANSPPPRGNHEMVYDLARNRIVMFGGFVWAASNYGSDTWEYRFGQPAASAAFGVGCGTPPLGLLQDNALRPVLGEIVGVEVVDAATPLAALAMGLNNQTAQGQPLPLSLSSLGMSGCWLYHSAEVVGLGVAASGNSLSFASQLPLQPAFIGTDIFVQAYALAPGATALEVVTSNALHWVLGDA